MRTIHQEEGLRVVKKRTRISPYRGWLGALQPLGCCHLEPIPIGSGHLPRSCTSYMEVCVSVVCKFRMLKSTLLCRCRFDFPHACPTSTESQWAYKNRADRRTTWAKQQWYMCQERLENDASLEFVQFGVLHMNAILRWPSISSGTSTRKCNLLSG